MLTTVCTIFEECIDESYLENEVNRVLTDSQYHKSRPDGIPVSEIASSLKGDFVPVFLPGIPPGPLQGRRVTTKYLPSNTKY